MKAFLSIVLFCLIGILTGGAEGLLCCLKIVGFIIAGLILMCLAIVVVYSFKEKRQQKKL